MKSASRKQKKQPVNVSTLSLHECKYEEVGYEEDDFDVTEGDEDLDATLKAIQDRADARAKTLQKESITDKPLTVNVFLRRYLSEKNMSETLDCFQHEWAEMVEKGLVDESSEEVVPQVYVENQRLERDLRNGQREMQEYKQVSAELSETLKKAEKSRDIHCLRHKRAVREKNRMIEEIKTLKQQCEKYEPHLRRMDEKYQASLQQAMKEILRREKSPERGEDDL